MSLDTAPTVPAARPGGSSARGADLTVEPSNPVRWLLDNADHRPDAAALRWKDGDDWRTRSWREVADDVARAAAGLRALGIGAGDRVVLMLRNRPEFHVVDLAALALRATPISIYNSSSPEQVTYLVSHSKATAAVVEGAFLERFTAVRGELPGLQTLVVVDDGGDSGYDDLLAADPLDLSAAADQLQPDDLATVIYTSGTTGPPKGVMIDVRNVVHQVVALRSLFTGDMPDPERGLSFLPMAHIAERVTTHYGALYRGTEVTTCPDLTQLGAYLGATRPHVLFGPPRVWEKLKAGIEAAVAGQGEEAVGRFAFGLDVGKQVAAKKAMGEPLPDDLAGLWTLVDEKFAGIRGLVGLDEVRHAITGAAPIPVEVVEFFRSLGVPFAEVYGMSENTGAMTLDLDRVKPGTVGRPLPGVEVRIAEDGEVLCKGEIVFRGYLDDPEKTAEALDDDGWLRTGDIGVLDDEGYLRIVDRKKELIITAGGKNVSPANLEAALKSIPLVGQACVIGDGRKFLSALLVLDPEAAPAWAAAHGKPADLAALAEDEDVRSEIAAGVEQVNARFSQVEQL
ncbi:MAG TPA: AMP-dependent synthetase/ligase, partial [Mycobacteriales bacterium]|nr:AMP-dependent synthetase/ligase [Mycobacteriales bacterium]